ncbi:hypothetical protein COBT_000956 [Conglomerata obtusa]
MQFLYQLLFLLYNTISLYINQDQFDNIDILTNEHIALQIQQFIDVFSNWLTKCIKILTLIPLYTYTKCYRSIGKSKKSIRNLWITYLIMRNILVALLYIELHEYAQLWRFAIALFDIAESFLLGLLYATSFFLAKRTSGDQVLSGVIQKIQKVLVADEVFEVVFKLGFVRSSMTFDYLVKSFFAVFALILEIFSFVLQSYGIYLFFDVFVKQKEELKRYNQDYLFYNPYKDKDYIVEHDKKYLFNLSENHNN